jgi:lysozyme
VQALELLRADAATAVTAVNRLVTVPLNQTQFDALVSFVFNLGEGSFSRSTLLTRINEGADSEQIRAEFLRWNRAGGRELRGLTRRRAAEADLFIDGTY